MDQLTLDQLIEVYAYEKYIKGLNHTIEINIDSISKVIKNNTDIKRVTQKTKDYFIQKLIIEFEKMIKDNKIYNHKIYVSIDRIVLRFIGFKAIQ